MGERQPCAKLCVQVCRWSTNMLVRLLRTTNAFSTCANFSHTQFQKEESSSCVHRIKSHGQDSDSASTTREFPVQRIPGAPSTLFSVFYYIQFRLHYIGRIVSSLQWKALWRLFKVFIDEGYHNFFNSCHHRNWTISLPVGVFGDHIRLRIVLEVLRGECERQKAIRYWN